MKNVIGSILLMIVLLLSLFLYREGSMHQDQMTQEAMTASALHSEKEKTEEEPVRENSAEELQENTEASEENEAERTEEAEEEAAEEAAPSRKKQLETIKSALSERISQAGGEWSAAVSFLPSGEGIEIESRPMVAASLIKLYVAGACLEAAERGEIQDQYEDSLHSMLSQSDNDAANRLIRLLGMDYINAFIQSHEFGDTRLNRLMLENNGLENYTSVRDCARLLEEVWQGSFVSEEASERILSALREQRVRTKIPAGLPEGVACANKTGELAGVENDCAIIFAPSGDYVFCVMSGGISAGRAYTEIGEMSRTVYETLEAAEEADR